MRNKCVVCNDGEHCVHSVHIHNKLANLQMLSLYMISCIEAWQAFLSPRPLAAHLGGEASAKEKFRCSNFNYCTRSPKEIFLLAEFSPSLSTNTDTVQPFDLIEKFHDGNR